MAFEAWLLSLMHISVGIFVVKCQFGSVHGVLMHISSDVVRRPL